MPDSCSIGQPLMDMRKSFGDLTLAIEQIFLDEFLTGAYFIFLNKRKNHIKVLYFDTDGLVIFLQAT
jgi:transposase